MRDTAGLTASNTDGAIAGSDADGLAADRDAVRTGLGSGKCPSGDFMSRMNRLSGGPS